MAIKQILFSGPRLVSRLAEGDEGGVDAAGHEGAGKNMRTPIRQH
jgi:hypothetical protein